MRGSHSVGATISSMTVVPLPSDVAALDAGSCEAQIDDADALGALDGRTLQRCREVDLAPSVSSKMAVAGHGPDRERTTQAPPFGQNPRAFERHPAKLGFPVKRRYDSGCRSSCPFAPAVRSLARGLSERRLMMAQDTRKDPRAKVLTMTVRYKSATVDEFIEHHSHDVSRGGIFIKTPSPFLAGTLLKFEIRIADDKAMLAGRRSRGLEARYRRNRPRQARRNGREVHQGRRGIASPHRSPGHLQGRRAVRLRRRRTGRHRHAHGRACRGSARGDQPTAFSARACRGAPRYADRQHAAPQGNDDRTRRRCHRGRASGTARSVASSARHDRSDVPQDQLRGRYAARGRAHGHEAGRSAARRSAQRRRWFDGRAWRGRGSRCSGCRSTASCARASRGACCAAREASIGGTRSSAVGATRGGQTGRSCSRARRAGRSQKGIGGRVVVSLLLVAAAAAGAFVLWQKSQTPPPPPEPIAAPPPVVTVAPAPPPVVSAAAPVETAAPAPVESAAPVASVAPSAGKATPAALVGKPPRPETCARREARPGRETRARREARPGREARARREARTRGQAQAGSQAGRGSCSRGQAEARPEARRRQSVLSSQAEISCTKLRRMLAVAPQIVSPDAS